MADTIDPVGPAIAANAVETLAAKAELGWPRMAVLAILAGAFIAFGSVAFLIVQAVTPVTGPVQLLSGVAFSAGLLMVMVAGVELFTGNTMIVLPVVRGRLGARRLLGAWSVVWLGNLVGSVAVAGLFVAAGGLEGVDGAVGTAAAATAETKLAKGAGAVFASAILANMLVCMGVWMAMGAKTVAARALAVIGPVAIFVAAGLEHSIANMSLLPLGIAAGEPLDWAAVLRNLAASTLGNIVGGATLVLLLAKGHSADDV